MSLLEEKLKLAKIVLSKLEDGPKRWTELLKLTLAECGTPHKFQSILDFLLEKGYVDRPERGLYRITDKGRQFLQALNNQ